MKGKDRWEWGRLVGRQCKDSEGEEKEKKTEIEHQSRGQHHSRHKKEGNNNYLSRNYIYR